MKKIKLTGTLRYEPPRVGFKKTFKLKTLIVEVKPGQLAEYYQAILQKERGPWLKLVRPMYGYHVTIVSGKEKIPDLTAWKKHEGEKVEITYDIETLRKDWSFWNFRVDVPRARELRTELGMKPDYHFHLTAGRDDSGITANMTFDEDLIDEMISFIPPRNGNQLLVDYLVTAKKQTKIFKIDALDLLKMVNFHIPDPHNTGKDWERKIVDLVTENVNEN